MGDLVQFVIDGTAYPAVVREVMIEWKPDDGIRITPTIGDPGSSNDPAIVQHYQTLATRVSYLEANWNLPPITTAAIGDIGTLRLTAAAAASTGWLLCQGQTVSRTTYAALFAVLGTTFNTGGESGTVFRLPDMRGRFAMGASATYTRGQYGGAATYDMTHIHPHNHGGTTNNSTDINTDMGAGSGQRNAVNHEHPIDSDSTVGGSATQSVLNPYLALNYEIFSGVV
ncbi:MAG: tail fiber protein [Chloroflexi bacterium]|nr:tail fiber protein [Chloroflexota bacterium]